MSNNEDPAARMDLLAAFNAYEEATKELRLIVAPIKVDWSGCTSTRWEQLLEKSQMQVSAAMELVECVAEAGSSRGPAVIRTLFVLPAWQTSARIEKLASKYNHQPE